MVDCKRIKILYIMGIDWNWIFQRPQILEQYLEQQYEMTVIFPRSILKFMSSKKNNLPKHYKILWTVPLQEKIKIISWITNKISKNLFKNINRYDAIVIGYPLYYRYIPESYNGILVYDCMDNQQALYTDKKNVYKLVVQENLLIEKSNAILASSYKLYLKISSLLNDIYKSKVYLVRNGSLFKSKLKVKNIEKKERYKIGYFGTIAEWFDYEILNLSVDKYKDIEYHLIGPVNKKNDSTHERIIFEGIIDHSKLCGVTEDYDCLIMPFIVTDVVEWVDPVKLYEYIALGKCIISVKYDEIERFEKYVYFYSSKKEYIHLLDVLKHKGFPAKFSDEEQQKFINDNTWHNRFKQVDSIIKELIKVN